MKKEIFLSICLIAFNFFAQSQKVQSIQFNARTGKLFLNDSIEVSISEFENYVKKGRFFEIKVFNYNQFRDSLVFTKNELDVRYTGDEATNILASIEDENRGEAEAAKNKLESTSFISEILPDSVQFKKDSLEMIILASKVAREYNRFNSSARHVNDTASRDDLSLLIDKSLKELKSELSALNAKFALELKNESEEINLIIDKLEELKFLVTDLVFEKYFSFIPKMEETDLELKVIDRKSKNIKNSMNLQLITCGRFKIISSIGAHVLITDGKYARKYSNVDSVIVSNNTSNIQPSIGTYLNGVWRVNDALIGLGLGMGIPFDGSGDLTPNFSINHTMLFQTSQGRFGYNFGVAIRKVDIIAAGYTLGGNLGNASIDVPLISAWKPALLIGVSYNIGSRVN